MCIRDSPDITSAAAIVNGVRSTIISRVPETARDDDVALVAIRIDDRARPLDQDETTSSRVATNPVESASDSNPTTAHA